MHVLSSFGLVIVAASLLSSCALPYYFQAARGQVGLLRQRVPVDEIVEDGAFDVATRDRLELIARLRRFAVDELDLPDNDSYTSYVDLGRDYVVWNVVATEEFSVDPLTWCFPVAGCVAYRGYFDRDRAERFAERLELRGYDVYTGGSPAYSTLGYFDDPILSTMIARGEAEIAAMLFHELAHQRVYVKDDTELSESFATAVEQYGVTRWLERTGQTDALSAYRQGLRKQRDFATLVAAQRQRLLDIYKGERSDEETRLAKRDAFDTMRDEYAALNASWNGNAGYDAWFADDVNNAKLAAATSYQRWVPGLRQRLRTLGPKDFLAEIEALVELDADMRAVSLTAWNREVAE